MEIIREFIQLQHVRKGDLLLNYDGKEEVVESIESVPSTEDVYNIEVSDNHNYYAEGVLVHNRNKWGSYVGNDKAAKAAIKRDKASYQAMIDYRGHLTDKALSLQETDDTVAESQKDIFESDISWKGSEYGKQREKMESQVGSTGLVASTGDYLMQQGKETLTEDIEKSRTQYEAGQVGEKSALEAGLFDLAQRETDLFAGFIGSSATLAHSSAATTPEFETGYTGGTEWTGGTYTALGDMGANWGMTCFSADTKVDDKDISKIKEGDMVASYNIETGIIEKKEVVETFRHKNDRGYLLVNGRILATGNHSFYVRRKNNG